MRRLAREVSSFPRIVEGKAEFDELVIECIDEGLKGIFGEMGAQVILNHLNLEDSLRQGEIVEKLEVFRKDLRELLGSGAVVVERAILKILYSKLREEYSITEENNFADRVTELRNLSYS